MVAVHSNGGGVASAWRTRQHFLGHVVSDGRGKVGVDFGLATGQFGPRAQMQSCSSSDTLQLLFRVPVD